MRYQSSRIFPFVCVLLVTACDATPTGAPGVPAFAAAAAEAGGGAQRWVEESVYHLGEGEDLAEVYLHFACTESGQYDEYAGELVRLTGVVRERAVLVQLPSGGWHATWQTWPMVTGRGVDTGEEFRVREHDSGVTNQAMGAAGRFRYDLRLRGVDTGRTFSMVFSGSFTLNANGEFVVERDRESIACRG